MGVWAHARSEPQTVANLCLCPHWLIAMGLPPMYLRRVLRGVLRVLHFLTDRISFAPRPPFGVICPATVAGTTEPLQVWAVFASVRHLTVCREIIMALLPM